MILITVDHFLFVHAVKIVKAGILVESLLEMMSGKRGSLIFNLWLERSSLFIVQDHVSGSTYGVQDYFFELGSQRDEHDTCFSKID